MRRLWPAAVLALPIIGLAAGIVWQETGARGATIWTIPVTGYDPRDPLRGRFIAFQYDWQVRGPAHLCRRPAECALCLEDRGRAVRVVGKDSECPDRINHETSAIQLRYAPRGGGEPLIAASRLFVSERSAPLLERQLATSKMVVVARLTHGGRLINDRLEPAGQGVE